MSAARAKTKSRCFPMRLKMEAFRTIKKAENGVVTVQLPDSLSNLEVEVIVLPVEEKKGVNRAFDPLEFKGIWKNLDVDVEKICREMREGWERHF